jgi:hypothetical protein
LGACAADSIIETAWSDPEIPEAGEGFFYLVQAWSDACGPGPLTASSTRLVGGRCVGAIVTDARPWGEESVWGHVVSGSVESTWYTDGDVEFVREILTPGTPPAFPPHRLSLLEHRWLFDVTAGDLVELHVRAWRTVSPDWDDFALDLSTDGVTWTRVLAGNLPFEDRGRSYVVPLLPTTAGAVAVRVVDTDRTPAGDAVDGFAVEELFIRTITATAQRR